MELLFNGDVIEWSEVKMSPLASTEGKKGLIPTKLP